MYRTGLVLIKVEKAIVSNAVIESMQKHTARAVTMDRLKYM